MEAPPRQRQQISRFYNKFMFLSCYHLRQQTCRKNAFQYQRPVLYLLTICRQEACMLTVIHNYLKINK